MTLPHGKMLLVRRAFHGAEPARPAIARAARRAVRGAAAALLEPQLQRRLRRDVGAGQGREQARVRARGDGPRLPRLPAEDPRAVREARPAHEFWGDIIMQHPELIGEMPRDVTALEWGYEHDHPFDADTRGVPQGGAAVLRLPRHRRLDLAHRPHGQRDGEHPQRGDERAQARRDRRAEHRLGRRRPHAAAARRVPGLPVRRGDALVAARERRRWTCRAR